MSLLYFVSFVFLFGLNLHVTFGDPNPFGVCDEKGINVTYSSGQISLANEPSKNCTWNITTDSKVEAFLYLENIRLGPKDNLTISSINKNGIITVLAHINESLSNNLFFTGTKDNLIINLVTSADNFTRSFVLYLQSSKTQAPLPLIDDSVIKFLPLSGKADTPLANWTFEISFPSNKEYAAVASVDAVSSGISLKFDNNPFTFGSSADQIGSSISKINLGVQITNISEVSNQLNIFIYHVTYNCSSYISLTSSQPKITIQVKAEDLENLVDIKCLWIIQSDQPNGVLNIDLDSPEMSPTNYFAVQKGNKRTSPVLFDISSFNYDVIKSNVYNSIINSSSLYITYEAFEIQGQHPHFDVVKPDEKNFISDNGELDFSNKMPKQFVFKASKDKKAVLSTTSIGQSLPKDLYIYDQPVLNQQNLLAVFKKGNILPSNVWSDSDLLVLSFSEDPSSSKLKFALKSTPSGLGSTARQSKGSLALLSNQLGCGSSYSWIIPPKQSSSNDDYQTVKSLVFSNLAFEKGSSLSLTPLSSSKDTHSFNIGGDATLSMSLPTFYLDANISYMITYNRAASCDNSPKTLIQVSVDTISNDACADITVSTIENFKSYNYPNYYPLTEWGMTKQCRNINSTSSHIYITFNDVDLADGHHLEILDPTGPVNLTESKIPSDVIVSDKVAINFDRHFDPDAKTSRTLGDKLSGRGFNTTLEALDCGGFEEKDASSLSINGTAKPIKCVWIIRTPTVSKSDTVKFLNFSISDGLKDARIYDSDKRRPNSPKIDLTGTGPFNSTSETIIVEFTSSTNPVQINWTTVVCLEKCNTVHRCINPSERCNNVNDCGDWTDELHCNGSAPVPPQPKIEKSGVPGLVVVFVIMPLSIIFGVLATIFAPRIMSRIRGGPYQSFREYSDVS